MRVHGRNMAEPRQRRYVDIENNEDDTVNDDDYSVHNYIMMTTMSQGETYLVFVRTQ